MIHISASNSSRGAAKLASVLQSRMSKVSKRLSYVTAEMGVIIGGNKLKVDSIPDDTLSPDDYGVCSGYKAKMENGDRVLVIWTNNGEPIIVDRIL